MEDSIELSVHESDSRVAEEQAAGCGDRQPFMSEGSRFVYWREPRGYQLRAVYNIPPEQIEHVVSRIRLMPSAAYEDLVRGIPGAAFGDEHADIRYVSGDRDSDTNSDAAGV